MKTKSPHDAAVNLVEAHTQSTTGIKRGTHRAPSTPRRLLVLILVLGVLAPTFWPAAAQGRGGLRISVSGANFKPYPVAVPALADRGAAPGLTARVSELLRTDVGLSRTFELVPPKTYLAADASMTTAPVYSAWQNVGASGLIRGEVTSVGDQVRVTLRFDDVSAQKMLLTRTCTVASQKFAQCVHQFLDLAIEKVTGELGVFSSRLAFVRKVGLTRAIYAVDMDGTAPEKLVASGALSLLPAWDSLGRSLFFTSYIAGGNHLYRLATPTGRIEKVSARPGLNIGAAVSPDGKRVALTLTIDGNSEIYTMDLDGKNLTRLTQNVGLDVSPSWSPDGKRLAFVSNRSGHPHIYVMGADGTNVRRITFKGTYNQEPNWSPAKGGQIAFTARDESLHYDIFLVDPDTTELTRLTQNAANNMSPAFSPDGQHIAFVSDQDPKAPGQLMVMDVDGRNPRAILGEMTNCETPAWSPRLGY